MKCDRSCGFQSCERDKQIFLEKTVYLQNFNEVWNKRPEDSGVSVVQAARTIHFGA